jgi:hypothetical protein
MHVQSSSQCSRKTQSFHPQNFPSLLLPLEGKTSKTSNKIIGFVMNWQVRRGGQGAKCIGSNNKNGK